jgi:SAM-dependent methyltransferase
LKHLSFKRSLSLIRKFSSKAKKILEIGCAKGDFLSWLPSNYKKFAVEINQNALKFVKDNHRDIKVLGERIELVDSSRGIFDVVLFFHVLEHIDKPNIFFAALYNLLGKDGVVILEIPNSESLGLRLTKTNWFHLDTPRHLFFYSHDSLKILIDRHNLKIVSFSGNPIDYFQDLPISILKVINSTKQNVLFKGLEAILILPLMAFVRLFLALFIPKFAEINTYVIKRKF